MRVSVKASVNRRTQTQFDRTRRHRAETRDVRARPACVFSLNDGEVFSLLGLDTRDALDRFAAARRQGVVFFQIHGVLMVPLVSTVFRDSRPKWCESRHRCVVIRSLLLVAARHGERINTGSQFGQRVIGQLDPIRQVSRIIHLVENSLPSLACTKMVSVFERRDSFPEILLENNTC